MSYNEELKNNNFDLLSGMSKSYYDDIFCPSINDKDKVFTDFLNHKYKGINNETFKEYAPTNDFYDCRTKCELKDKCTGYAVKMGKCYLYGSYPKAGEIVPDNNSNFFLKKDVYFKFDKLNSNQQKRIRKYCQGKSVRNLYEKINNKSYDGLENCVNNIKLNNNKGYIDLNMSCVWKNLKKSIKDERNKYDNHGLGKKINSPKLDNYEKNWNQLKNNKEAYNKIEEELSKYDTPEYFPEYYKTLDENYARIDGSQTDSMSGLENTSSSSNSMSGLEDTSSSSSMSGLEESFVVKGGPKREQLARVKDYGCNNIYFVLLLIPFLLICLGIYYNIYGSKNGKNKNL